MNLLRLIFLLSICCFLGAARELPVIPAQHPEQLSGRWEVATQSGIKGIAFEIVSQSNGVSHSGGENFVLQQVNVWVYRREGGKEKGGYFSALYRPKPKAELLPYPTSFEVFDGRHLRIHFNGYTDATPFDLDIFFSPKANKWIGTWSHDGKDERVTLTRPEANNDAERNKFVGEWIGQPSPDNADKSTSINIRQSSDGVLSAWLDDPSSGYRRNGYHLNIESISDSTIVLATDFSSDGRNQFRGSLSADGQTLTGQWCTPHENCETQSGTGRFCRVQTTTQKSGRQAF